LGDGDDLAIDLGDGAAMVTSDVTVEDALDGETPSTYTYFRPANGAGMATAAPAGSWAGVPGSLLEAGDLHHLTTVVGSLGTDDRRRVMTYVRQPDDVTVTLPPVSDAPAVEVVGVEPYGRIATTLPDDDGVQVYTLYFESTARYWYEDVTRGWLDAAGTDTIELAELSDLDGWDDAWGFAADAEVAWYSIAQTGNRSAGDVMDTLYMTLVPPLSGLDGLSVGEQWTSGDLVVE
ncbi:MAG TPA: hypothetical protein VMZ28_00655, partial [Kofleriaceae bacterium]|nr:hypothetical protein [Kofleriaceae bacterium]